MERPNKDVLGYIHCQGDNCKFESKKSKNLAWFKGKLLCRICRLKASKSLNYVPKLNISESSLNHIKLTEKELEKTKPKKIKLDKIEVDNKFCVSITKDEYNYFKRKLMNQGLTGFEAHNRIGVLIDVIKSNHKRYKKKEINFAEEFSKLI